MKRFLRGAAVSTILYASTAFAQTQLSFSGGGGFEQLSMTLLQPVVFTITAPAPGILDPYLFVFNGVGDVFSSSFGIPLEFSPTITYMVNNGTPHALNFAGSGPSGDLYIFDRHLPPALQIGDVVTMNAGTLVTTSFGWTRPADGTYPAAIYTDARISTFAAPVPEPGSLALLAIGGIGLMTARRYRVNRKRGKV